MARLAFAVKSLQRLLRSQPRSCPYCGSANTTFLQRKKLLLELRRCEDCCLMFRYPKDDPDTSFRFYQEAYEQGVTTDLPKDTTLSRLIQTRFAGSEVDLASNIAIVKRYKQSGRLLDYGCSWGYGVYQFTNSGFEAVGFEISKPRAALARHALKVDVIDSLEGLDRLADASFDIIHCSHVLEHIPQLRPTFAAFRRLLRPSGLLVVFVPNAGGRPARSMGVDWGPMISEKHCFAFDAQFFARNLPAFGFAPMFGSSPHDSAPVSYVSKEQAAEQLPGEELLVVAQPATSPGNRQGDDRG